MGSEMIPLLDRWNVEREGKRLVIRNKHRRIIAVLDYVSSDDIAECDLAKMIAAAPVAFGVCQEFLRVWRDGSKQREKLDQVVRYAEIVVEEGGNYDHGKRHSESTNARKES